MRNGVSESESGCKSVSVSLVSESSYVYKSVSVS